MPWVDVYGFGSYFRAQERAADIDLLLLHEDTRPESVAFAIRCKGLLKAALPNLDAVMLSQAEEIGHRFIEKSGAMLIGRLCERT